MPRIHGRRINTRVLAVAVLTLCALQVPAAVFAAPAALLPDLRMEKPQQLTLERSNGHYWLRFSAWIENAGDGPLEVRSTRRCATCTHRRVDQAILRTDTTWSVRRTRTQQRYDNSDHHQHWHVMGMERYELFPLNAPFANGPLTGHKRGFCFFDGYPQNTSLPNYHPSPVYSYFGCGTPSSQTLLVGLSVGWGDLYPYNFAGQYVDLAGVTPGDYLVCLTADPSNWFREKNDHNNMSWAKIHIPDPTSLHHAQTRIAAIATEQHSCKAQLPYAPQSKRAAARGEVGSGGGAGAAGQATGSSAGVHPAGVELQSPG